MGVKISDLDVKNGLDGTEMMEISKAGESFRVALSDLMDLMPSGPGGAAGTVKVGTVTLLPAGSVPTVVNVGTNTAAILNFGIPKGDQGNVGPSAIVTIGTVTILPYGSAPTVTNSGTATNVVLDFGFPAPMEDAPSDGGYYQRRNLQWVAPLQSDDFFDVNAYWPEVTLGPGNVIFKMFPRQALSAPILDESYIRRDVTSPQVLYLDIQSTAGGWVAQAVIPANQQVGYFVSETLTELEAADGFFMTPNPLPEDSVEGLTMMIRFRVLEDAAANLLSVPAPAMFDTLFVGGTPVNGLASFAMIDAQAWTVTPTSSPPIITAKNTALALSYDARYLASINATGTTLTVIDTKTQLVVFTLQGQFAQALSFDGDSDFLMVYSTTGSLQTYSTLTWTLAANIPTAVFGITQVNSIAYTSTSRQVAIGHSGGLTLLNATNWTELPLPTLPITGPVIDAQFSVDVYMLVVTTATGICSIRMANRTLMTTTVTDTFTEIKGMAWLLDVDVTDPNPFLLIYGTSGGQPTIIGYRADATGLYQMAGWKMTMPAINGVAVSYPDNADGKQFAVTHPTDGDGMNYTVMNLLSREVVHKGFLSQFTSAGPAAWYKRRGEIT